MRFASLAAGCARDAIVGAGGGPPVVIARCAKRAVAIQLDYFVAALVAMTSREYFG
jgi:hypothetical protein